MRFAVVITFGGYSWMKGTLCQVYAAETLHEAQSKLLECITVERKKCTAAIVDGGTNKVIETLTWDGV